MQWQAHWVNQSRKRTQSSMTKRTQSQDRNELRNVVSYILNEEFIAGLKNTLRDELKQAVQEEIKTAIRAELDDRLTRFETQLNKLSTLHDKCQEVEDAINFTSHKLDDLCDTQMPALASHVKKVATTLALQTLDLDVHRRKRSLTIQGIKGDAGEEDAVTRKACLDLVRNHLGIADATEKDFSACHRLTKRKDAGIIIRLQDLSRRNEWLDRAKNLCTHTEKISISPDLPPLLRHLKTELLQKRKDMSPEHKKESYIKYLRQWPYVELTTANGPSIRPSAPVETIVTSVLGFNPLFTLWWL